MVAMALLSFHVGVMGGEFSTDRVILDDVGIRNLNIQTVEVEEQEFERTVFAIGRIAEIPSHHSVVSTRIAGRISALHAFEGDYVQAGQQIGIIESRQLGNPPPSVTLQAPQAGLVVESHVRVGQPVEPNTELMDISDRSKVWAIAKIPEQESAQVKIGSLAHIHIPAFGDTAIDAELVRFGVTADRQSGTVEGIFELANTHGTLRPGMRAEFSIVLTRRDGVMAVPREAVQGDPARRVVFVKDFELDNAFIKAPVVLGEQNDRYVEIVSGLFPGDEVVTSGSYLLGFVGKGSTLSLKEALDAAHGHEHNEDGSEITKAQGEHRHAGESGAVDDPHEHDHDEHDHSWLSRSLVVYAGVITILFLIAVQRLRGSSEQSTGTETKRP